MTVEYYQAKDQKEILKKTFINQKDFFILVGKRSNSLQFLWGECKKAIKKDLEEKGKRLPDSRYLPLNLVLDFLKDYGITRENILENAEIL